MLRTRGALAALLLVTALAACEAPAPDAVVEPAPCPATVASATTRPDVPQQPTADTGGRLVPTEVPTQALLCRYEGPQELFRSPPPVPLVGQRELTGLERLPDDLFLPRDLGAARYCQQPGGQRRAYLLRLTYPDGVVWVSTVTDPGGCATAGNGAFVAGAYVGARLDASYAAGAWTAPPARTPAGPCDGGDPGRAGQEGALVPGEPTALRVCNGQTVRDLPDDVLAQVREVLSDPVAEPAQAICAQPRPGADRLLQVRYRSGPVVLLRLTPGCRPDITNGSLQAQLTPAQEQRLDALLG